MGPVSHVTRERALQSVKKSQLETNNSGRENVMKMVMRREQQTREEEEEEEDGKEEEGDGNPV